MATAKKDAVTDRHLLLFGRIIQGFAAHELLIERILAHVMGTQVPPIILLTRALTFEEKRKAVLDLLWHAKTPLDHYDCVNSYLSFMLPFARLRHDIIHSTWSAARTGTMIQPDWILNPPARIHPVDTQADRLPGDFVEDEEEKLAYSADELAEIAAALDNNCEKFEHYLAETGLLGKI